MEKTVPGIRGKATSETVTVPAGRKCPQLLQIRGRFFCALYPKDGEKDARPKDCQQWNGTGLGTTQMLAKTEEWILNPASKEEVAEIQELIDLELFHTASFTVEVHQVEQLLRRYLVELQVLPHDIFHMIGLGNILKEMAETHVLTVMRNSGLDERSMLYRKFMEVYVGKLGALNIKATDGFLDTVDRRLAQKREMAEVERKETRRRLLEILLHGDKNNEVVQRASRLIHEVEMLSTREELGALLQVRDLPEERFCGP
ncbi:hypothetical protein COV83_00290 [Candidatus Peregrinibacteria bacterium CG11_big_fil_rev_8_21_14_0_20_49_14]|nr:MAG: hypothetical protein COV83_00290 [Candidatus Peregrinibacteria bacterium CG11_big_fil_rev_8_21_14_0_20_49_14]